MSLPRRRLAPSALSRVALAAIGTLVLSPLAVLGSTSAASGQTTVSPTEPGSPPVVRNDNVNIDVDVAGLNYYRSTATGKFAATLPSAHVINSTTCRGDNPAGTNNSPRTTVTVTDPAGTAVLDATSPVRDMALSGFLSNPPHQPLNPQPAPSNSNFRGDFPATTKAYHGMHLKLDLTGHQAGTYTVVTSTRNTVKTGTTGACLVGTPTADGTSFAPGLVVETHTFEYRPWAYTFTDILGKGKVRANIAPAEVQATVTGTTSDVLTGKQTFYSLDSKDYALPSDPQACADDPSTCIPAAAVECDPSAGCHPRLMVVNQPLGAVDGKAEGLQGVFDLDTKAFIAWAAVHGHQRLLMSLGQNDAYYHDLLAKLGANLATRGIDLPAILATEVDLGDRSNTTTLSLLNGLQIDPSTGSGGVHIRTKGTAQAGVLLDIYSNLRLAGGACVTNTGSSAAKTRSYTPKEDAGYTVRTSDYLPTVPGAGPLAAIVGGRVYSIAGDFTTASTNLVNTASAVIGVDTASDEPKGYPVWIEPFLSSPAHVTKAKTMDFLGTATWSASETPIAAGCLTVDFMLGTGVALFDNPLGVGLRDAMNAIGTPNAGMSTLMDAVDKAVADAISQATADPTVAAALEQVVGLLPLSALP